MRLAFVLHDAMDGALNPHFHADLRNSNNSDG
jgi:hypothetical protein